jgi:RES domain-containing protein
VRVWRLCQTRYANEALSGEGGLRGSARWHFMGTRIVYSSSTLSLAALEVLIRVNRSLAPLDLVAVEIDIPSSLEIERLTPSRLSSGWDANPAPAFTREIGSGWVSTVRSAILEVPSAVIPRESNYLLNPAHPQFGRIRVAGRAPFSFDPRLLR